MWSWNRLTSKVWQQLHDWHCYRLGCGPMLRWSYRTQVQNRCRGSWNRKAGHQWPCCGIEKCILCNGIVTLQGLYNTIYSIFHVFLGFLANFPGILSNPVLWCMEYQTDNSTSEYCTAGYKLISMQNEQPVLLCLVLSQVLTFLQFRASFRFQLNVV